MARAVLLIRGPMGARRRSHWWVPALAALGFAACNLNPQPLPPGFGDQAGDDSSVGGSNSSGGSFSGGGGGSSSGGDFNTRDASATVPASDAMANDLADAGAAGEGGPVATDASPGPADASVDGPADASADGPADASVDGPADASADGPGDAAIDTADATED
jgi:hypothetical protein